MSNNDSNDESYSFGQFFETDFEVQAPEVTTMAGQQPTTKEFKGLPFPLDMGGTLGEVVDPDSILDNSKMSPDQSKQTWDRLIRSAGTTAEGGKAALATDLIKFFIKNGSSPRQSMSQKLTNSAYGEFDMNLIKLHVGSNLRQFMRANAEIAREILRDPRNYEFAESLRVKCGLPTDMRELAFDFALGCEGLTDSQRALLVSVRNVKTANAAPYETASIIRAVNSKSSGGMPGNANPSGSWPHGGYDEPN